MKNILEDINFTIYVNLSWYVMVNLSKITDVTPIDLYISKFKLIINKLNVRCII